MGRNLFILAATFGVLAMASFVVSVLNIAPDPGAPTDAALWRFTGIFFLLLSLLVALGGVLSSLFEQAERRTETEREDRRRERSLEE